LGFDGSQLYKNVNPAGFVLVPNTDFSANGYNALLSGDFGSPIAGQQAWSGGSAGYDTPA
jgi:hypothetical protein